MATSIMVGIDVALKDRRQSLQNSHSSRWIEVSAPIQQIIEADSKFPWNSVAFFFDHPQELLGVNQTSVCVKCQGGYEKT